MYVRALSAQSVQMVNVGITYEKSRLHGAEYTYIKITVHTKTPRAHIAQLVEQLPCKQKVAGSIPAVGMVLL